MYFLYIIIITRAKYGVDRACLRRHLTACRQMLDNLGAFYRVQREELARYMMYMMYNVYNIGTYCIPTVLHMYS